jgi:hypothetical protein
MHEPVNYDDLWIFMIAGVVLICLMLLITTKLTNYLDKIVDRRYEARKAAAEKDKKAADSVKKDE